MQKVVGSSPISRFFASNSCAGVGSEGLDARSDLAGLNLARVPAALVELGNMREPAEASKLRAPPTGTGWRTPSPRTSSRFSVEGWSSASGTRLYG